MKMKNKQHLRIAAAFISVIMIGILMTACGKNDGEQRYAYPLATASPEDTVTQIYAEKFAEEVDRLSGGSIIPSIFQG